MTHEKSKRKTNKHLAQNPVIDFLDRNHFLKCENKLRKENGACRKKLYVDFKVIYSPLTSSTFQHEITASGFDPFSHFRHNHVQHYDNLTQKEEMSLGCFVRRASENFMPDFIAVFRSFSNGFHHFLERFSLPKKKMHSILFILFLHTILS